MNRIRLAHFTTGLADGGIEERVARILAGLDRARFAPVWLAFGEHPADVSEDLLTRAGGGIPWAVFEKRARGIDWSMVPKVAITLRRHRPDVLHVHNWSTGVYGIIAGRLAGVPRIVYGTGGREHGEGASRRQRRVARGLAPMVDRFTTVCQALARELSDTWRVPERAISVIRTGVDVPRIAQGDRGKLREELGIPPDATVVGTVAVDRPVKRLADLFAAATAVARAHPRVHILWIGNAYASSLEGPARSAGVFDRCHVPGRLEDAGRFAKAFDIFVNCSAFEGSSNAILESMAGGAAIVATAVGGTPELIHDGETGLLVPPASPDALRHAIEHLVDTPLLRARLGANAHRRVRAAHDPGRMVEAYRELYESAHAARARARLTRSWAS